MRKLIILISLATGLTTATCWVAAQQESKPTPAPVAEPQNNSSGHASPAPVHLSAEDRIEGEKRFRANCSRCHQAPHKFSPRATATIVRHMRVRATITDEDARLILKYLSQ